ncbi:MAG TPA: phospholipase D-like domain-containing protein [Candidatus Limnocylindrales bacterium]|nr:phospholipase D-like domain-containing protein [Candidatus Limnocylindrales bacterium]
MTEEVLDVRLLTDGGQRAEDVAAELAAFLEAASATIEIAIYDLNLSGPPAAVVAAAVHAATGRGVKVRLAYNVDFPEPIPIPPPAQPDQAFIDSLGVPVRGIAGVPALMHHKYAIRDAATPNAAVWTGSTNWTNDSWTREENVIVRILSQALAGEYRRNFEELWSTGRVEISGKYDLPLVDLVDRQCGPVRARVYFSPGRGRRMAHLIADRLAHARRRIRLCSPVISDGPILGTLAEMVAHPHPDFKGVYDRTQMQEVLAQWQVNPHAAWKAPAFKTVAAGLPFGSKVTTPYSPTSVHDYMHAKVLVVDDTVLTGSYNLSHSGEENAENLLELKSSALADFFAGFIDQLYARYAPVPAAAPQ